MSIFDRYNKQNENSIFSSIEKRRKSKVKDYTTLADGQIVYTGKYYNYIGSKLYSNIPIANQVKQIKLLSAVILLLSLLMGFLKVPGMINTAWIILIYVVALLVSIFITKACFSVKEEEKGLKEPIYLKSIDLLPRRTMFLIIVESIYLVAFVSNIVYMIFNKNIDFSIKNGNLVFNSLVETESYFQGVFGEFSILLCFLFLGLIIIEIVLAKRINRLVKAQNWEKG